MRAVCGRAPTAQSPQLPEGPALQQGGTGSPLCLPWARASLGSLCSQQSPGTQGTKYMPCCGQALPGKRSQRALSCPTLREVTLGLGLPFARSVRGAQYQPARLSRSKTEEKGIWHSLSARPVSTCTYESCSSARCLCLPRRLVMLGFVTRALALPPAVAALPARCWPPARPGLLLPQHQELTLEMSLGFSLVWHLPPEACGRTLVILLSAPATLILQQRFSSRIEKPRTLLHLLYLLSLPCTLPWPS